MVEISYTRLVRELLRNGILTRDEIKRLGYEWLSRIVQLVNQGYSIQQIQTILAENGIFIGDYTLMRLAEFIQRNEITGIVRHVRTRVAYPGRVLKFLPESGIKGRWSFELIRDVIDAYLNGVKYWEIARRLHISIAYVKSFYDYLNSEDKVVDVVYVEWGDRPEEEHELYEFCECHTVILPYDLNDAETYNAVIDNLAEIVETGQERSGLYVFTDVFVYFLTMTVHESIENISVFDDKCDAKWECISLYGMTNNCNAWLDYYCR